MKTLRSLALALVIATPLFTSCGDKANNESNNTSNSNGGTHTLEADAKRLGELSCIKKDLEAKVANGDEAAKAELKKIMDEGKEISLRARADYKAEGVKFKELMDAAKSECLGKKNETQDYIAAAKEIAELGCKGRVLKEKIANGDKEAEAELEKVKAEGKALLAAAKEKYYEKGIEFKKALEEAVEACGGK